MTQEQMVAELQRLSKQLEALKVGKRNNAADQKRIQTVHDLASEMGGCSGAEAKAGQRFSESDLSMVKTLHDHAVNLGAECPAKDTADSTFKSGVTKTEGGESHPSSHYLVVEDAEKPSTWHLRVKNQKGETDHRLMGAAWAALHGGYRGNKYEGSGKAEALGKLKKLYKAEGLETPSEGKSVSIQDLVYDLRSAWERQWQDEDDAPQEYPDECDASYFAPPVMDVLEDAIVIHVKGKEWKVPYTVNGVDDYSFSPPSEWVQVEGDWTPVKMVDVLASFGSEVKVGADGRLSGRLLRFSSPSQPDSTGDYFDKETELQVSTGMKCPVFFHHTLPLETMSGKKLQIKEQIGEATLEVDDEGVLVDAILFNNFRYRKAIMKALEKKSGSLGWSSGTAPHLVIREKVGKSWHIKRWPLGLDASITPTPAEITNEVVSVKTYHSKTSIEPDAETGEAGAEGSEGSLINQPIQFIGEVKMPQEEFDAKVAASVKAAIEAQAAAAETAKAAAVKAAQEKSEAERIEAAVKAALAKLTPAGNGGGTLGGNLNLHTERGDDPFKAFNYYLKTGDGRAIRDPERYREQQDLMEGAAGEVKAYFLDHGMKTTYNLLESTQYQGQELVPTAVYDKIVELRDPQSVARAMGAEIIPVGTKTTNFPVEKTRSGKFVIASEGSSYDANTVQPLDKVAITVYKFTRTIGMGLELMEDSVADVTKWWTRHVARMEALTENYYFTLGNGSGQPTGAITGGTAAFTTATGGALLATEVKKLFYSLTQPYRDKVAMSGTNLTEGAIRNLTGNFYAFAPTPSGSVNGGISMGEDWIVAPSCKYFTLPDMAEIAISAKSLLVGNWAFYIIAERSAMSIFRDPYSSAGSGLVNFHCHFRRGGAVTEAEAFQYLTGNSA